MRSISRMARSSSTINTVLSDMTTTFPHSGECRY